MILQRLRTETKDAHQALEKLIIPRIKNIKTTADYIDLLDLFCGYFKPMENLLDQHLDDNEVPHYSRRRKADNIISDIHTTGGRYTPRYCRDLPDIRNTQDAIGALYVLEGSTLGGKIISKMIRQCLSLSTDNAFSFFTGYGEDTEAMWSSFTEALNNYTGNPEEQDQIAQAANQTFIKFKNWVEQNTPALQN